MLPLSSFASDKTIGSHAADAASLLKPKTESVTFTNQQAKHQKVTGQVVDENGETVIGASVVLKSNPKVGAVTDADGKFTLTVSNTKDVLVVSYLGYQSQEVPMKGKTIFSITLKEDAKQLGDVVVTAFGATQKKETVVGSVQQVKPESLRVPSASISSSFAGRLSGVIATQSSGQPGANGSDFYIRGIATISGAKSPLTAFCEDAFKYLDANDKMYDLIVLDPPAFAKHRAALRNALKGYTRLNVKGLQRIKPGGILFTFSCSQIVSKENFRNAVFTAAVQANRKVRILHQIHQPADHPINIYHPEGEYLKGLVLYVE